MEDVRAKNETPHVIDENLDISLLDRRLLMVCHIVPTQVQVVELFLFQNLPHQIVDLSWQYVGPCDCQIMQILVVLHKCVYIIVKFVILK